MSATAPQAQGLTRSEIQVHDLSVPGLHVIQNRVDISPTRRSSGTSIRVKR
jgi:hypothetical protein